MGLRSRLSTWRSRNPRAEATVRIVAPWQTYQSSAIGSTPDAYLESCTKNGVVFQIVSHISESVAAPDWCLKRVQPDGEEVDVPKHPVLTLLNHPNPIMSRFELIEQLQQYIELLGEGALQVSMLGKVPLELWPLMPHRMIPITHPTRMITGWQYITPGGETVEIPGGLSQIIRVRRPHPTDLLRGLGPVQPATSDIATAGAASDFTANFLDNGAFPSMLYRSASEKSDEDYERTKARMRAMNTGRKNAGRVLYFEGDDEITPISVNLRDVQFPELSALARDGIIASFAYPRAMLGITDGVPRDVAETQERMFQEHIVCVRLNRLRDKLNSSLLPLYRGIDPSWETLRLDYESPIEDEDEAAENAERDSKVAAAVALIAAGFDPAQTLQAFDLPDIPYTRPSATITPEPQLAPETVQVHPVSDISETAARIAKIRAILDGETGCSHAHGAIELPDDTGHPKLTTDEMPDLQPLQDDWETAVSALLDAWAGVKSRQYDDVIRQIVTAVTTGDWTLIAKIALVPIEATSVLSDAMTALARLAASRTADEMNANGAPVTAKPATIDADQFSVSAGIIAALMARRICDSAAWAALKYEGTSASADDVAEDVRSHLDALTDAQPKLQLGGALSKAQQHGRVLTMATLPGHAYYGNEVLDDVTCTFCKKVHGRWLGNSLEEALVMYPGGQYISCLGGSRCRGQIVVVYRGDEKDWIEKAPVEP